MSTITSQPSLNFSWSGEHPSIAMAGPKATPPANYREWSKLFSIYMVVRMEMWPQEGQAMITYAARIGDLEASEAPGVWYQYDVAFRKLRAMKPDLPWQRILVDILWPIQRRNHTITATTTPSYNDQRTNQPFHKASGGSPPHKTCTNYYYKGTCNSGSGCGYKHICGHCRRPGHSLINCRNASAGTP